MFLWPALGSGGVDPVWPPGDPRGRQSQPSSCFLTELLPRRQPFAPSLSACVASRPLKVSQAQKVGVPTVRLAVRLDGVWCPFKPSVSGFDSAGRAGSASEFCPRCCFLSTSPSPRRALTAEREGGVTTSCLPRPPARSVHGSPGLSGGRGSPRPARPRWAVHTPVPSSEVTLPRIPQRHQQGWNPVGKLLAHEAALDSKVMWGGVGGS